MIQVRYDEERGIYRDCRFCGGKGCLACPAEADKAYKKEFPDGPQPMAVFRFDDPKDMEIARNTIGFDALKRAFGPKGGGVAEIDSNIKSLTHQREIDEP